MISGSSSLASMIAEVVEIGPDTSGFEVVPTRFGEVAVNREQAVFFPQGLLGMPDKYQFALAHFPSPKMSQFKLFQSLDDHDLSFITLPLDLSNPIIEEGDISQACQDLDIPVQEMVLLLIVSVHRMPERVTLSVNARAPLLIDVSRRHGAQYVFMNDKYKVQHIISA